MASAKDKLMAVTSVKEPTDLSFPTDFKLWTYNFRGKSVYEWNFDTQLTDLRVMLDTGQASTVEIDLEDSDFEVLNDPLFSEWAWNIEDVSFSSQKKFKTTRLTNSTSTAYLGDSADLEWVIGQKPVDFRLADQILFRLCGIQTQQTTLTLTLEDRVASWLRDHKGALSWDRSQHTRAQFVAMLCRQAGVEYFIPEINVTQPIAADTSTSSNPINDIVNPNGKGISNTPNLTLFTLPMTATQKATASILLGECHRLNAPLVCWQAILYAAIGETRMGSVNYTMPNSAGAVGVLQGTDAHWKSNPNDTAGMADSFLQGGYGFNSGGAIALAKAGVVDLAEIAVKVEVPSIWPSNAYEDEWGATTDAVLRGEIDKIIAAYGGPSATGSGTATTTGTYAFTRGANETSWDCIQRLASEVGWYAFVRQNRLWFVSGNYLFSQAPQLTCGIGEGGVEYIDLDIDMGERDQLAQCQVYCRAGMWTALPGMVVEVVRRGPASGKWIVSSVEVHPLDRTQNDIITLQKPIPKRAEPQASTSSSSSSTSGTSAVVAGIANPAPNGTPGRLDMGIDGNYDMSKGAVAAFSGTLHYGESGWPGQGRYFWIKNDDQSGPDYTRAIYYAEGALPSVPDGSKVQAGQKVGTPVSSGGDGQPGNFEIGPANTTNGDCLAKQYGLGSSGAADMVKAFSKWLQGAGMFAPSSTDNAGNA